MIPATSKRGVTCVATLLLCAAAGAQEPQVAASAPKDKPVAASSADELARAIAPFVAQARATYPQAKARFLGGLPRGESLFLTTTLVDAQGRVEQVFVAVESIEGHQVVGRIWSQIQLVTGYRFKDRYTFTEDRILDWLITKPDGSEEGNFVGKFLDTYHRS
jgi:hypothetical protein